tara:strand:+ start:38 stop:517 length:480 start_codon:yes stop_codon:yes gene_type:complete
MSEDVDKYGKLYILHNNILGHWATELVKKLNTLHCSFEDIPDKFKSDNPDYLKNGINVNYYPTDIKNNYQFDNDISSFIINTYINTYDYIIEQDGSTFIIVTPINLVLDSVKKNLVITQECIENIKTILNHPYFDGCKNLEDIKKVFRNIPDFNLRYQK